MKQKILFGFIGGAIIALIGLFIGMNLGGNYFTGFEFMGGRGYEAVGYLGAILGAVIGVLLGILLDVKLSYRRNKN